MHNQGHVQTFLGDIAQAEKRAHFPNCLLEIKGTGLISTLWGTHWIWGQEGGSSSEILERHRLDFLHSGEYITILWWKCIYLCKEKHKFQNKTQPKWADGLLVDYVRCVTLAPTCTSLCTTILSHFQSSAITSFSDFLQ